MQVRLYPRLDVYVYVYVSARILLACVCVFVGVCMVACSPCICAYDCGSMRLQLSFELFLHPLISNFFRYVIVQAILSAIVHPTQKTPCALQ